MSLLGRLFGVGEKKVKGPKNLIEQVLNGLIEKAGFDLSFDIEEIQGQENETFKVSLYGEDEGLLIQKDAMLLDALQLFVKRALQNQFSEQIVNVQFDSNDYRAKENENLEAMIDKLKEKVLSQGKPVYVKALAPKERRVVHQFLARDERIRSKSIGDGHYKKIKIFSASAKQQAD